MPTLNHCITEGDEITLAFKAANGVYLGSMAMFAYSPPPEVATTTTSTTPAVTTTCGFDEFCYSGNPCGDDPADPTTIFFGPGTWNDSELLNATGAIELNTGTLIDASTVVT